MIDDHLAFLAEAFGQDPEPVIQSVPAGAPMNSVPSDTAGAVISVASSGEAANSLPRPRIPEARTA